MTVNYDETLKKEVVMKKHGLSHGLSVLVCTIASSLMVDMLREYVPLLDRTLYDLSTKVIEISGLHLSAQALSPLILASFLAVIWGMAFAKIHRLPDMWN